MSIHIRPMLNTDAEAVIALVKGCFDAYPGCEIDLQDLDADLLAPASSFWKADGYAWIAEDAAGTVVGCGGCVPKQDGLWELKRLYVAAEARRKALGTLLLGFAETTALDAGATGMELWSDSRFEDGHAFYIHHGYAKTGETRDLMDVSHTTEYRFVKPLEARLQRLKRRLAQTG